MVMAFKLKYVLALLLPLFGVIIYLQFLHKKQQSSGYFIGKTDIVVDAPHAQTARVPQFKGMDTSFLNEQPTISTTVQEATTKNIWQRKYWDIDYYNEKNLPVVVGELKDKEGFSSRYQGRGLRFLDLPIHIPGQ